MTAKTTKNTEMYHKQAMSLLGQGESKKSLEFFDKALSYDATYMPAWNNKGIALLDLGEYGQALKCFEKVNELNPNDTMAMYNRGYVLLMLERFPESVEIMNIFLEDYSLKRDDFFKFGLFLLAKGYYGLKDYQKCKDVLENVITIDKNFKEANDMYDLVSKEIK